MKILAVLLFLAGLYLAGRVVISVVLWASEEFERAVPYFDEDERPIEHKDDIR